MPCHLLNARWLAAFHYHWMLLSCVGRAVRAGDAYFPEVSITRLRCGHHAGIAVIADMLLTTHFLALLMVVVWRKNMVFPAMFYIIFGSIEAVFVSSALRKVSWPAGLTFLSSQNILDPDCLPLSFWRAHKTKCPSPLHCKCDRISAAFTVSSAGRFARHQT